jgi:Ca2+-transporting ATPase
LPGSIAKQVLRSLVLGSLANSFPQKDDRVVRAIRSGRSLEISVYDILVGDVLHLEPGDLVPADGVLISGYNVRCDESSATGESDPARKVAAMKPSLELQRTRVLTCLIPLSSPEARS